MGDQRSRNDFSKLMYDELDKREAKLAELEKNPFDNNGKRLSEQEIEKKRREIMENFYGVLDGIKSMPGFKEAQDKHHEEIRAKIAEMIKPEDQKLLEELKNAKTVEKRVKLFVTLTDKIPLDALAGILPVYGDIGMSVFSTVFLIYQGRKIGLSGKEIGKIVGFQIIDAVIGMIGITDVAGDILDYFFKANKFSAKYFTKKVKELEEEAKRRGIDPKKIENIENEFEKEFEKKSKLGGKMQSVLTTILGDIKKLKAGKKEGKNL